MNSSSSNPHPACLVCRTRGIDCTIAYAFGVLFLTIPALKRDNFASQRPFLDLGGLGLVLMGLFLMGLFLMGLEDLVTCRGSAVRAIMTLFQANDMQTQVLRLGCGAEN